MVKIFATKSVEEFNDIVKFNEEESSLNPFFME